MNYGNECFIIYDKFGGESHSFNNPLTKQYTVKYLFENIKNEYISGKQAIEKYPQEMQEALQRIANGTRISPKPEW